MTRQGMVDETLPTTGWTHLLEHLALHDRASGPLHVNGSVSLLHTRLDAHGPADRVAQVLEALTGWIAEPRFDELAREQSVLRAEAAMRGAGEVSVGLLWRYGAGGPGLSGYAEPGLSRADARVPDRLWLTRRSRAATRSCSSTGRRPRGWSLHLPDGELRRAPAARPCDDTLPAAYLINAGITLSGVVPRSVAGTVVPHVLREVLTAEFRERDGGAYAPWAHYEPVDDESAVVFAGSDANDALLQSIADRAIYQLGQVAKGVFKTSWSPTRSSSSSRRCRTPTTCPAWLSARPPTTFAVNRPWTSTGCSRSTARWTSMPWWSRAAAMRSSLMVGIAREARWTQEMPILGMPSGAEMVAGAGTAR